MADYLQYWKLERAQRAFDEAIKPLAAIESAWYRSVKAGDRLWIASGDKHGLVLVLRHDVTRTMHGRKPPQYATGNSRLREHTAAFGDPKSNRLPRAIPLGWSLVRQLRFETNQPKISGTPQSILSGPLTGLKRLSPASVESLQRLWDSAPGSRWGRELVATRKGLIQPNAEQRAAAEKAAILAVKRHYEARDHMVIDRQTENVGYDLEVVKGNHVKHVEVKGSVGDCARFILTANEHRCSLRDKLFLVCAVSYATSRSPRIEKISGKTLKRDYEASALAYQMTKR